MMSAKMSAVCFAGTAYNMVKFLTANDFRFSTIFYVKCRKQKITPESCGFLSFLVFPCIFLTADEISFMEEA